MTLYKELPNGIKLVEYDESLAPAIADMWNRSGEGWGGRFGDGIWTKETAIAQHESGANFNVFLALEGAEVVGYCSLKRYYKDQNTAYVQLLSVRPDCHGKGIGKELILLSLQRTIELKMPRLDLHTWPGNIKAMPMYKKCGFMWEDRSDTTLLSNFIPTVLATELFEDFFKKADWYADSTRKIDTEVDGVKHERFEMYEYKWVKGKSHLTVGFEKSGRRIRLVETENYKVEMTAKNHEAAFGFSYPCMFEITNKKSTPLEVKIAAKNDDIINFTGKWDITLHAKAKETIFTDFYVREIEKEFDTMRVHPSVLADIQIDGKHVEFGLGIEPKFPVEVTLKEKRQLAKPGRREVQYLNIKNNLSRDATISFTLPDNSLTKYDKKDIKGKLKRDKDVMLKTTATVIACGYECPLVRYEILYDDTGEIFTFEKRLHIVNQGLEDTFYFETNDVYGAANGLWCLTMRKKDNKVVFDKLTGKGHLESEITNLGMPLDEEFNIMEPSDVRVSYDAPFMKFEADFRSKRFAGALLTEIYEFDNAGTIKKSHRLKNEGVKSLKLTLSSEFWSSIGRRAVFHYDGDFHEVKDSMIYGFDSLSYKKIDENWIFDKTDQSPSGVYWPKELTPKVNWGDGLTFTVPLNELKSGEVRQTEPYVFMFDVFDNYYDFRNYVLGIYDDKTPFSRNHLQPIVNDYNPIVGSESLVLALENNRQKEWSGSVEMRSTDGLFEDIELAWEFDEEDSDDFSPEEVPLYQDVSSAISVPAGKSGVFGLEYKILLSGYEIITKRAILITDDFDVKCKKIDDVLNVTNRELSFEASPGFIDGVHSLKFRGKEWLVSGYPVHEPKSWFNPFIGGIKTGINKLGNRLTLREKITGNFTREKDVLGNQWVGLKMDVSVHEHDKFRGVNYSQYFLTLPGVPVLCHYIKVHNHTGRYLEAELWKQIFFSEKNKNKNTIVNFKTPDGEGYKLRFSGEEDEIGVDKLIRVEHDGEIVSNDKLYVYSDSKRDKGESTLMYDLDTGSFDCEAKIKVPDGETYTAMPMICILTDKDLEPDAFEDFSRIQF